MQALLGGAEAAEASGCCPTLQESHTAPPDAQKGWRGRSAGRFRPAVSTSEKPGFKPALQVRLAWDALSNADPRRAFLRSVGPEFLEQGVDARLGDLGFLMGLDAAGAPVRFSDRPQIEAMLERAAPSCFGMRTLIRELAQSELFGNKSPASGRGGSGAGLPRGSYS